MLNQFLVVFPPDDACDTKLVNETNCSGWFHDTIVVFLSFFFHLFFFSLNISWSSDAFTGSLFNNIARCPALERVAHWSHIKKTRQPKGSNHYFLASWNWKGGWTRRRNGILNGTDGWVWPSHETNNNKKKHIVGIKSGLGGGGCMALKTSHFGPIDTGSTPSSGFKQLIC